MQVDTSQADFLKVRQVQAEKSPWQRLWGAAMRWVDNTRAFPAALLLPVLLFFIIWNVVPTLWMIGLSFYKYALISGKPPQFIGTANYNDILKIGRASCRERV